MGVLVVVLVLIAGGALAWAGYLWAEDDYTAKRTHLATQRQILDAEWRALDGTRQVRAVLLAARRAMQEEARRQGIDNRE